MIGLRLKQVDRFFLHFEVRMVEGLQWELTTIYVSPSLSIKRNFWKKLDKIEVRQLWALVGDFNCVLLDDERSSSSRASSCFQNWVRGEVD